MAGTLGVPEPEGTADAEDSLRAVLRERWTKTLVPSLDLADGSVPKKMRVTGEGGIVVKVHAYPAGSDKLEKPEKEEVLNQILEKLKEMEDLARSLGPVVGFGRKRKSSCVAIMDHIEQEPPTGASHVEQETSYITDKRYLPLIIWKRKGFDEKRIEQIGDKIWDEAMQCFMYGVRVRTRR